MPGGEHDLNVQTAEPENLQDKIFALEKQVRELEEERNSFIGVIHEHD
jgi:polyhydroxyalkanoate synthesis regulator phasin